MGQVPTTNNHLDLPPIKEKSRWQSVVAGVSANLGMISDDTIRGLKYCLQYLQYAVSAIDGQISILRQYVSESQESKETSITSQSDSMMAFVGAVKRQVVETLRRIVDLIGRYAAIYLPGDARQSVRGFILSLPGRLALLNRQDSNDSQTASVEAQHVLTLASESSTMLKEIENVFNTTVSGAEQVLGTSQNIRRRRRFGSKQRFVQDDSNWDMRDIDSSSRACSPCNMNCDSP